MDSNRWTSTLPTPKSRRMASNLLLSLAILTLAVGCCCAQTTISVSAPKPLPPRLTLHSVQQRRASSTSSRKSTRTNDPALHSALTYSSTILPTNKSCSPHDTCSSSRHDRNLALARNCHCDRQCIVYDDCCVDSPYRRDPGVVYSEGVYECRRMRQFGSFYLKTRCGRGWRDAEVRSGCESTPSAYDPIASLPITNTGTGVTFKNYYCALCNNESMSDKLVIWPPRLECPSLAATATSNTHNLEYRPEVGRWGVSLNGTWTGCGMDPVVPSSVERLLRPCRQVVSDCPANYTDKEVARLCPLYTATIHHLQEGYRNVHCALCNGLQLDSLHCTPHGSSRSAFQYEFNGAAFSILFDLGPGAGPTVGKLRKCGGDQIWDPFFTKCRSVLCRPGEYYQEGGCHRSKSATARTTSKPDYEIRVLNAKGVATVAEQEATGRQEIKPTPHDTCPTITLSAGEYSILENGSVHVPEYDLVLTRASYSIAGQDHLLICAPATSNDLPKFGPLYGYLTFAFCTLSSLCLLLHLLVTALCPELHTLSGRSLASLSLSLLLVYAVFMATPWIRVPSPGCTGLSVLLYYSLLASFTWMGLLAVDVYTSLRRASTELRTLSGPQWRRFACYSVIGWMLPALFVVGALFAEERGSDPYRPLFGVAGCWFGGKGALAVFFVGPVGVIMAGNLGLFWGSWAVLRGARRGTEKARVCRDGGGREWGLHLRLAVLMGLGWGVGIIAGLLDSAPLWTLFILLNTLHGLFILVAFSGNVRVWRSLRGRCLRGRQPTPGWTWNDSHQHTASDSTLGTKRSELASEQLDHEREYYLEGQHQRRMQPRYQQQSQYNSGEYGGRQVHAQQPTGHGRVSSPTTRSLAVTTEMYIS